MSNIRSVVKVMNFHSLLRVDKSRTEAKKLNSLEDVLVDMIDNIVNNRNIMLDHKTLWISQDKPVLNLYIGSDMGFCNNLNSLVKRQLEAEEDNSKNIVIGRKIRQRDDEKQLLFLTREEYDEDDSKVMNILESGIRNREYSSINLIYNHYHNSTNTELVNKQIFPIKKKPKEEWGDNDYREDFTFEGEVDDLLTELIVLYVKYSVRIAMAGSYASENISRQNVTTESLHKIDERDEERQMALRRENRDKQFTRVLDVYTKINHY